MKIKIGQRSMKQSLTKLADVLLFGKHKGKTIEWILNNYPHYIVWLHDEKVARVSTEIWNEAQSLSRDDSYYDPIDMYDFMDEPF